MLWGHTDGKLQPPSLTGLLFPRVICLPIESTYLFCWIILPGSVISQSLSSRSLTASGLEGHGPSTVPLHSHPQTLRPCSSLGLGRGLPVSSLCHPNSSSFKVQFRHFIFQKPSLSPWLGCSGMPLSCPQIPPLQR